jgi:chemotaxis protein MotB
MAEVRRHQATLRRAVEETIQPHLRRDIGIAEDGSLQRYTFADWILFDSASAELKPSGAEVLTALGRVFRRYTWAFSNIQIAGHTDNQPLRAGARFASNWELSSARATSVVRFLEDRCGLDPRLLSATGFSEYHPVDAGPGTEARARNRRIEVVVVYSARPVQELRAPTPGSARAQRAPRQP